MKRLILIAMVFACLSGLAAEPKLHCSSDAAKINEIISQLRESDSPLNERVIMAAENFIGAPEDDYYAKDSVADLRVNAESFSPLMFVNSAVALAKASLSPGNPDWRTFYSELENISCRRGENVGFPSIMYHTSDWIGDNISRGNLSEMTENYSGVVARTKSLDEMTRKRDNYAALADSAIFETVRMTEMGFRTHRVPSLKKETVKKKEVIDDLRDGDILIMVPNRDGIDCYDIGFIKFENGAPYLIHLSPQTHSVVKEKEDLARYMGLMTKHFQGYRLLRLKE